MVRQHCTLLNTYTHDTIVILIWKYRCNVGILVENNDCLHSVLSLTGLLWIFGHALFLVENIWCFPVFSILTVFTSKNPYERPAVVMITTSLEDLNHQTCCLFKFHGSKQVWKMWVSVRASLFEIHILLNLCLEHCQRVISLRELG